RRGAPERPPGVRGDAPDCDCETALPDTSFVDLCAISARLTHPVAVLDPQGDLVGVVPRRRLVAFLGDEQDEPGRCTQPRNEAVTAGA
ncbi:glycine/betaine ABC transporter ATP-binding protein, partial [Streptomyces sp. NPDC059466]